MSGGINPTTPQLKAVKNFIDAYLTRDVKNVEPLISKDFKFQTFPKITEHPDEAKDAHFERYGPILTSLTKLEITYHEVIEAPGKVIFHATADIVTADGTELDYDSLVILTLVEEDGVLKIADFKDFSDPEKRTRVHALAQKAK
ncbi:hypothetical protein BJ322DRAFT_1113547 [Thelephora terrestris]|uniref:SnoaL-like domain-containing protein n=1 Tax=Thelephora terrestris TaxID=56493 RepID=A0A9P6L2D2_9AGAM|nr:hypothetical protein BJ322DRAFT_1113547 [Thelephora terrestris]